MVNIIYFIYAVILYFCCTPGMAMAQTFGATGSVQQCQQSVAAIERELTTVRNLQNALREKRAEIAVRLAPFEKCQEQTKLYVPGHALADGNGCLDPQSLTGLKGATGPKGQSGRDIVCFQ